MEIDNSEAGRQFAILARAVAGKNETAWFSLDDMLNVADNFGICGVFNSDMGHWRLVLKVNDEDTVKVYDPLDNPNGGQIYDYDSMVNKATSMPSRPLQRILEMGQKELLGRESLRLSSLRNKGYSLSLPERFNQEKLQKNGSDCGPLVLYAALVGNKHTPQFADIPRFEDIKQYGIEII